MNRNLTCFVLLCFATSNVANTLFADESSQTALQPQPAPTAVASDRGEQSAVEVAREVLRLQQQLGGSVVDDRPQLENLEPDIHVGLPTRNSPYPPHLRGTPDTTLLTWPEEQSWATDRRAGWLRRIPCPPGWES